MKKILVLIVCVLSGVMAITAMGGGETMTGAPAIPEDSSQDYLIINYLLRLNQFEKAAVHIDRYLEKKPDDPFILTEKAFVVLNLNDDADAAMALLKQAELVYPDYYYANYLHGSILFTRYSIDAGLDLPPGAIKKTEPADPGAGGMSKEEKQKELEATIEKSIGYLERAVENNRDFYDGHFLLGVALSDKGEYAQSNKSLETAAQLKETIEVYSYISFNCQKLDDSQGEVAAYKKVLEINPHDYRALSALSQHYLENKDFKSASTYLERMFLRNPGSQKLSFEYLYSLFASGETEKFLEVSNIVDILDSPLLIYARALLLSRQKKYAEAEKLIKSAKATDINATILLAEIYLSQQDYFRAYQVIHDNKHQSVSPLFYSMKLQTLSMLNLNRLIIDLYQEVRDKKEVMANLTETDFYMILYAYANLDRFEEFRAAAGVARLQLNSRSKLLAELADILLEFSPDGPLKGFKLKFDRNFFLLLTFYKNRKQYRHAAVLLRDIIKKTRPGSDPSPLLELCDLYMEQDMYTRVEKLLKKLHKQFPGDATVKNFYAYFLARQNKRLEHALELSAQTLAQDEGGQNPAFLDTYGYILLRMGRLEEAASYLEKAYRKNPFDLEILEHMVDYYRSSSNHPRIIELYRRAVDNNVDFKDLLHNKIKELKNQD